MFHASTLALASHGLVIDSPGECIDDGFNTPCRRHPKSKKTVSRISRIRIPWQMMKRNNGSDACIPTFRLGMEIGLKVWRGLTSRYFLLETIMGKNIVRVWRITGEIGHENTADSPAWITPRCILPGTVTGKLIVRG